MNKSNPIIYQDKDKTIFNIFSKHGVLKVTIDTEDVEKIKIYKWNAKLSKDRKGFSAVRACPRYKESPFHLHNFITGYRFVDHIDGDIFNNRKSNLRECTVQQNQRNMSKHKDNSSGYKGVTFWRGKFKSRIMVNYKQVYLGSYSTAIEAARAYNDAALKIFGEFARLNVIL